MGYLVANNFFDNVELKDEDIISVNQLVAASIMNQSWRQCVLHLRSVSGLTNTDYLWYSLLCPSEIYKPLELLAKRSTATWLELRNALPVLSEAELRELRQKSKAASGSPKELPNYQALVSVVQVLVKANVVDVAAKPKPKAAVTSHAASPKKRNDQTRPLSRSEKSALKVLGKLAKSK